MRPLRLLLVLVLTVCAAVLVALPTQMTEPWRWIAPHWMYHATIGIGNVAAWMACSLAMVLSLMVFATWNDLVHLKIIQFFAGLIS